MLSDFTLIVILAECHFGKCSFTYSKHTERIYTVGLFAKSNIILGVVVLSANLLLVILLIVIHGVISVSVLILIV